MPALDLVAGTYRIDAAIHTRNGRAFDYRRGAIRFVVGSRVHDIGVYRPKHTGNSKAAFRCGRRTRIAKYRPLSTRRSSRAGSPVSLAPVSSPVSSNREPGRAACRAA